MKEFYVGMATIITGVITAIVHIYITLKAKQSAENISKENLLQQERFFERTKQYEYLNAKRQFLESKVNDIYNIRESIKIEKCEDTYIDCNTSHILEFMEIIKAINKTTHYINDSNIDKINEFILKLNSCWKERNELIQNGLSDDTENHNNMNNLKMFNEVLEKMPEMIDYSIQILTNSLKKTIIQIEQVVSVS